MRWGAACAALAIAGAAGAPTEHFEYERTVRVAAAGLNCAVLDPEIYAKAGPSLADLRLFSGVDGAPMPYVLTQSGAVGGDAAEARVIGAERRGSAVEFDLQMPARPYTDVVLQMDGSGFVAVAEVSAEVGGRREEMGRFGVFDLRGQGLGESTVLHLQETNAAVLRVRLSPLPGSTALLPAMVRGAVVPPSREAQTLFTPAVSTSVVVRVVGGSEARLLLPAHVPIERVLVTLRPGSKENFSRTVQITSRSKDTPESDSETVTGTIDRVHLVRDGVRLDEEQMAVPATLGANLQQAATVDVLIVNGRAEALPIASVSLEMRERRICFDAKAPGDEVLLYGDAALRPARYELPSGVMGQPAHVAAMGPEQRNASYVARVERPSLRARHPRLVYLSLAIGVCAVGVLVLRSAKLRV